jgi:hypothetical protein
MHERLKLPSHELIALRDQNAMLKNALLNERDASRASGIELEEQLKAVTEQRDKFKCITETAIDAHEMSEIRNYKLTEQRDRLAEALRKCREDSVCHQRRMEDLGYTYAAKESQANSDRAYIALQSLTKKEL